MIQLLGGLLMAAAMFGFGWWGRRNACALVPRSFSPYGRARKAQQIRRNATLIQITAGVLLAIVIAGAVVGAVSGS